MRTPPANVLRLYGIPNCDTVKKSRAALQALGWTIDFHDYKKGGVPADRLCAWIAALGWEALLNRQGSTWRKLDASTQVAVRDAASAVALMQAQPSVIRRPVIEWPSGAVTVGFQPERWQAPH